MKYISEKEKAASTMQILEGLKVGSLDADEAFETLEKLSANEFNSDIGRFVQDATSIAKSLVVRPVVERQAEPVLVAALAGLRQRSKPFLVQPDSDGYDD